MIVETIKTHLQLWLWEVAMQSQISYLAVARLIILPRFGFYLFLYYFSIFIYMQIYFYETCREIQYLLSLSKKLSYFVNETFCPTGDSSIIIHWTNTLSIAWTKLYFHKECFGMSKWHKINSQSQATDLGSWVGSPNIPLKVPKSRKSNQIL